MKTLKYFLVALVGFILVTGCQEEDFTLGEIIAPSNIEIQVLYANGDEFTTQGPGDGSGVVKFKAIADNAISYQFVYNGTSSSAPNGEKTYTFTILDLNTYTITAIAYGTGGASSSKTIEVEVLSSYEPPADLITMLTSNSYRTWRVKKESTGHFGVGPADSFDLVPAWWNAPPDDKEGLGAYDDRMTFNIDGSFSYVTNGDMYGKAEAMAEDLNGDQGLTPNACCQEYENYPYNDFTDTWQLLEVEGRETLIFNGLGYHGFYVGGDHSYTILARSENEMTIKTVGKDGNGWWGILIADE